MGLLDAIPTDTPFDRYADSLASPGSIFEGTRASFARQFDDTAGGGFLDLDTYNPFNNSQAGTGETEWFGETYLGGSGAGYQPGQSYDDDAHGFGPNDDGTDDDFLRRLEALLGVLVTVVVVGAGAYLLAPFVELLTVVVDDG